MKIVIDTNVILDYLAIREPFFGQASDVMQLVGNKSVKGAITANTVTDIYYVMRKHLKPDILRNALRDLMEVLEVIAVSGRHCREALDYPMTDYEDALLACCAKHWGADALITRNEKDFAHSPVEAMSPKDFLENKRSNKTNSA